jgi:hypothetical protein
MADLQFLGDQCPNRGKGYSHATLNELNCMYCGEAITRLSADGTPFRPPSPVVRLVPSEARVATDTAEIDEDAPMEPKMAEGTYPKQWRHDWGRMPWGETDAARLLFLLALRDSHLGD